VNEQRRLDFHDVFCGWLASIEWHRRREVRQASRQQIGDPTTVAETYYAGLAGAIGKTLQKVRGGDEILARLGLIELGKILARRVLVPGIAAKRC